MNLLTHFKQIILPLLITIVFGCFGLLPQAQAAKPGCQPNFTTAIGCDALTSLNGGIGNTGLGWFALFVNSTGNYNTALGVGALDLNNADFNTATGAAALLLNTTGTQNTAAGTDALALNDSGSANTANGYFALYNNTTGGDNTAIGSEALLNNTTGSDNTAIGLDAGANVVTAGNVTCIGSNVAGADVSNTTWIGNVFGVTTQSGTTAPVVVSDTGQLGTVVSSERFKKDIATMDKASQAILSFRPVTFHYKTDTKDTQQFGLIAEEVAKVNPALVLLDKEGKPYTVRYDAVNAMLLNEFLKEHKRVEEQQSKIEQQQAAIARQQKQIEALSAGLQKVSARLEVSKGVPQTVVNNQ
jgi:trimeric autotransporter adhesin